jgi:hypothetical protein
MEKHSPRLTGELVDDVNNFVKSEVDFQDKFLTLTLDAKIGVLNMLLGSLPVSLHAKINRLNFLKEEEAQKKCKAKYLLSLPRERGGGKPNLFLHKLHPARVRGFEYDERGFFISDKDIQLSPEKGTLFTNEYRDKTKRVIYVEVAKNCMYNSGKATDKNLEKITRNQIDQFKEDIRLEISKADPFALEQLLHEKYTIQR